MTRGGSERVPSLGAKSGDQVWGACLLYRFLSVFINLDKFAIEGSDPAWMQACPPGLIGSRLVPHLSVPQA